MTTSIRHILMFAFTAPLFTLAWLGCTPDTESDALARASDLVESSEARLEAALRGLDQDDLIISYYEASSHVEMHVELEPFTELARGFTIEMLLDVSSPGGTRSRHELSWTSGEDAVPQIVLSTAGVGHYEMVLESVTIDGRVIDGLTLSHVMRLRSEASLSGIELDVLATDTGGQAGNCGPGMTYPGTDLGEAYQGTSGRDVMYGEGGPDTMYGYQCGDTFYGGPGGDTLRGGDGWDVCRGGDGWDVFVSCEDAIQ
jgi:Ca2+-binding RTX toxin-like protein